MKYGLIALVLIVAAGPSNAGPQPAGRLSLGEPRTQARPAINFRLVRDPEFDPGPVYNSGMVAQTAIGSNATLGFGLLKAAPRKPGSGDWKLDNGAPRSRKAAISFRLRF